MPRSLGHLVLAGLACTALLGSTSAPAQTCSGISTASGSGLVSVDAATGMAGRPIFVASPPGDHGRIFIAAQDGYVYLKKRGDLASVVSVFLDISSKVSTADSEMGLLGLAFDPDYATSGYFYVNYTEMIGTAKYIVVARYSVTSDPDVANPSSEVRILRFRHPQENHNGGQLDFGPGGYLYIWSGDGGNGNDQGQGHAACGNGQSILVLLGKILRIDVRNVAPSSFPPDCDASGSYRIPSDNPYADGVEGGNCGEIWALGVRNPWRNSFDSLTGDLYVADVGQNCTEEVNWVPTPGSGGMNFGWRVMEGDHCFNTSQTGNCTDPPPQSCGTSPPCNDPSLTMPVLAFDHVVDECAVTGGYVYRGCRMPALRGKYFYGDYCAGFVRSFVMSGGAVTNEQDWTSQVDPSGSLSGGLSSFGVDAEGEIYITTLGGDVRKMVPPLPDLQVSGTGAAEQFKLGKAEWTWEDLHYSSGHPIAGYHVYRGKLNGAYSCIHETVEPRWTFGDGRAPAKGTFFAYVVTATNATGQQTAAGTAGTFDPSTCP